MTGNMPPGLVLKSPFYTNPGGIFPVIQDFGIWNRYGVLKDFEVQENDVKMKQPITDETLFEEFIEQIDTAVDVVATKVPYTRENIASVAFTMVKNAGIYYDGVKDWRRKDTADKT